MFKNTVFNATVDTREWLKAAGIRAGKTVAQAALAMLPAAATIGTIDWKTVVGTALLAGIISILTSVAGIPEVAEETGV